MAFMSLSPAAGALEVREPLSCLGAGLAVGGSRRAGQALAVRIGAWSVGWWQLGATLPLARHRRGPFALDSACLAVRGAGGSGRAGAGAAGLHWEGEKRLIPAALDMREAEDQPYLPTHCERRKCSMIDSRPPRTLPLVFRVLPSAQVATTGLPRFQCMPEAAAETERGEARTAIREREAMSFDIGV